MGLESLPPEVLDNIASNLDTASLCVMHATSSTLKSKSQYTYLTKSFGILNFCLNPVSLTDLTDISDIPELASYVRTVAFGTGSVGRSWFNDPLHDEAVKHRDTKHLPSTAPAMTLDELKEIRQRTDAVIIAEALAKFPRLEAVMLGRDLELNGHPVRPSWGRYSVNGVRFECSSNLCQRDQMFVSEGASVIIKYVFTTVCMALEQLQRQDIDIHLGLGNYDYLRIKFDRHSLSTWYPSPVLQGRITSLQLRLPNQVKNHLKDFLVLQVKPLTDVANIKHLTITYAPNDKIAIPELRNIANGEEAAIWQYLKLPSLTRLTVRRLWIDPVSFTMSFSNVRSRLQHLVLEDCVMRHNPGMAINRVPTWQIVMLALSKMPQLARLELIRPQIYGKTWNKPKYPLDSFKNSALALKAIWTTRKEVESGLADAPLTEGIYFSDFDRPKTDRLKYLNLREANARANPARYGWSENESRPLREHAETTALFRHRKKCHHYLQIFLARKMQNALLM